jgi:hypothetical protein
MLMFLLKLVLAKAMHQSLIYGISSLTYYLHVGGNGGGGAKALESV